MPVTVAELDQIVAGTSRGPHAVLGPHRASGLVTVRALHPNAQAVSIRTGTHSVAMRAEHGGIWVGVLESLEVPDYQLDVRFGDGTSKRINDPYSYPPTVGELDRHLINEGRHEELWTVLGAHVHTHAAAGGPAGRQVSGTSFAVWAPSAQGVRVAGDFNAWDGSGHPMRMLGSSGVWEIFIPGLGAGALYKYDVCGADGSWRHKADPLATYTQRPPECASIVFESTYEWSDAAWMVARGERPAVNQPMSCYEVHLGSWRAGLSYLELAEQLVPYVRDLGFTHVELMPVMEHPYGGSWGYHVSSFYAPTSRLGDPDGFRLLVDRLHQAGVGVILDWVPAHFATDDWALSRFDGTALYEHADPARGQHPEWGSLIFDFGRSEVRNFLVANALYWLEEFHADGLRVDGVASMLYLDYARSEGQWTANIHGGRENLEAVSLLQEINATVYKRAPGAMTIAEESTAWPGVTRPTDADGLGFGFKWNLGWMHDSLDYLARDPAHRRYHHDQMTFSMMYAYAENYVLPISHDEVVHGKGSLLAKMPGDRWKQLANLRAFLAYMWAHPGKQLVFMGAELAPMVEWAESGELDWDLLSSPEHRGVQQLVRDLNRAYVATAAWWSRDSEPEGFSWIDPGDTAGSVFSFVRSGSDGSAAVCVANFAARPHLDYRLGLPSPGDWHEVINTDAKEYCGSGVGNLGAIVAVSEESHGLPASATVQLPPLGTIWLRPT
ncbi:MAG: 1,4-alpha-glucan branching protein GlgB [Propionibacteriales bacterium]|nr:1,4-alpha-glucan branching protein GlgB [Propionibacteriales bacterium]